MGAEYLISKSPKLNGVIKHDREVPRQIINKTITGIIKKLIVKVWSNKIIVSITIGIFIRKLNNADKLPASNITFLSNG